MVSRTKLMKTKWYPRPHTMQHSWYHGLETAVVNRATIYPLVNYDEGLGAASAYKANPQNASFSEVAMANCFPESTIDFIVAKMRFALTKGALETDKVTAIRCAFMPLFLAFKDDYIAIDELSTAEIQDVLEMQTESTDRQGFPLYNNVKMVEKYANSALLNAAQDGLTTTQVLEGVAFSENGYYDMLQYKTNAGKLKVCQGGLKWFTLTRQRPIMQVSIKLRSKVKFMNPYAFLGVLCYVPQVGTHEQYPVAADTTNINHVGVSVVTRYNEWNQDYNMGRV